MKNKKQILVYGILLILIFIVIIVIVNVVNGNKNKVKESPDTTIVDNKATSEVAVEEIQFKEITKVYDSGITTIRAKMLNTTDVTKNVTIKIILKDENGNELKNIMQVVENLEPNKEKVFSSGIVGDYSNVKDITFEVVK